MVYMKVEEFFIKTMIIMILYILDISKMENIMALENYMKMVNCHMKAFS